MLSTSPTKIRVDKPTVISPIALKGVIGGYLTINKGT